MSLAQAPRQELPGPHGPGIFFWWTLRFAQFCAKLLAVKREQFFSGLRRWCRKNGRSFRVDSVAGKGSHVMVYVDERTTIVKAGELSPVYIGIVLKQLGIPKDAI